MQLKEKPELNQINQESEFWAKTYQPYQPLKERKSVARVDIQPKEKPELNQINEQSKFLAKTYQPDQPIKEPKSVATVDRTNLQPIKEPKSVATVDRQDLQPIKERESVATTLLKIILIDFPLIILIDFPLGILKILFSKFSVVAIIMIFLPLSCSELSRCNGHKAKQSEAKQYVGSMNRAQQAKYADKVVFSNSVTALGLGIKTQTANYNYSISATKNAAFSYAVPLSEKYSLLSHVGAVFLVPSSPAANNKKTTVSILCQAKSPGNIQPSNPILQNDRLVCGDGTVEVSK